MTVLGFEDARHAVEKHACCIRAADHERIDLLGAAGRVLAQEIRADRDIPPFPRATRDGFAVRAEDVARVPRTLLITGEIAAGADASSICVAPGECVEIMTGAGLPQGADAVVMVEYTSRRQEEVEIQRSIVGGENVVPRGSEARDGQLLLSVATRLSPAAVALAASVGQIELDVFRRPRVAVLATGDELVEVSAQPAAHQIRNSNTYSLAAQLLAVGAQPVTLPIARDEKTKLRHLIEEGLDCDLLLLTGGVSMGKYDLVEGVLQELKAEFIFTGAKIQPGKPIVFGKVQWKGQTKYFFGLPGNPVSTMVTFALFVKPMVEALSGTTVRPLRFGEARLKARVKTKTGLTRFLPAQIVGEFNDLMIELVRWQGSGDMVSTSLANSLLVIPPDRDGIEEGEMVSYLDL